MLTDELGSVLTSISAVAGSAAVTSNQAYSPYGTQRYRKGAVPTDKGFTGQYLDDSGLNYDHARYYDAVVGRFVSADIKQGNGQGMDPYSYVGNNPETMNDPSGQRACDPTGNQCGQPCGGSCTTPGSGNGGGSGYCNLGGCYDGGGHKISDPPPNAPPESCHGGGPRVCSLGNGSPGGSPKPTKPTPEQINSAKSVASNAAGAFSLLSGILAALGATLWLLSRLAFQIAVYLLPLGLAGWIAGLVLVGLSIALGVLAKQALGYAAVMLGIAGMFLWENKQDPSWWTSNNIDSFGRTVSFAAGVGSTIAWFLGAAEISIKGVGYAFINNIANPGTTIMRAGLIGQLAGLTGGITGPEFIQGQISEYIGKENQCLEFSFCYTS